MWLLLVASSVLQATAGPFREFQWPPHPRLRLNASGVERIRAATAGDPLATVLLGNLSAKVDYILAQPVPSGATLLSSLQEDIYPLGLLYRLSTNSTQRKVLARRAIDELLVITNLPAWSQRTEMGDIRFLTIAETMQGVSIGYDWFYEELTEAQRTTIEDGLFRAGLNYGMQCYHYNCTWVPGIESVGNCSSCWWIRAPMNWNVVCNGGVTIAALALADVPRYAAAAQRALEFAKQGIPLAVSRYGPAGNGAWPEGPGYWIYITKWLLATSEVLYTATGHDNGYMETPGVSDTGDYTLQMYHTPSGHNFNYGDAADGPVDSEVATNILGLAVRFAKMGAAAVTTAHQAIRTPSEFSAGGWDAIALALMRWAPTMAPDAPKTLSDLPKAAFYEAQAVGIVRSGWGDTDAYLGARGGDSTVTHQDLDHGSFVWETRGYRWVVDLGTENYGLPNMFLPFEGRYRYYRKCTRGHNTLAFRDPGGFDPNDAEQSDQAVNTFSALIPGKACTHGHSPLNVTKCGAGEVMVVNLTDAYAPQLPNGLPDPNVPVFDRPVVSRAFHVNEKMTALTVVDSISNSNDNLTWGMHTRAASITLHGSSAVLVGDRGIRMQMTIESTPPGVCSDWRAALVQLPNGTLHNETRFPLYGAKKVWAVCSSAVAELRVSLSDV